jgi:hypothetical protein
MQSTTRWCLNEGSMSSCTDDQNVWRAGEELLSKLVSLLSAKAASRDRKRRRQECRQGLSKL